MGLRCWLALLLSCGLTTTKADVLRVCESDLDYPPFSYFAVSEDGQQRQLQGFSLQLLQRVINAERWQIELVVLPFSRCLRDTANRTAADLVLTASMNEEREKSFIASEPFWHAHFHAFYLRKRFPAGLPGDQKSDLRRYTLCGVKGHNYSMFGLTDTDIDLGADSYDAVFGKIRLGRCEVFPYNLEVMEGYQLLGKTWVSDPEFAHQAIQGVAAWPFQMLIARSFPNAELLQAEINQAIRELREKGELEKLYSESLKR